MRLQVGAVYECRTGLTYACVAECAAETVRFKKEERGYKLLLLNGTAPGTAIVVPRGANITVGVVRLA